MKREKSFKTFGDVLLEHIGRSWCKS